MASNRVDVYWTTLGLLELMADKDDAEYRGWLSDFREATWEVRVTGPQGTAYHYTSDVYALHSIQKPNGKMGFEVCNGSDCSALRCTEASHRDKDYYHVDVVEITPSYRARLYLEKRSKPGVRDFAQIKGVDLVAG